MRAEIYWLKKIEHRLATMPRLRGGDWLRDDVLSLRMQGVDVVLSLLTDSEMEELDLQDEAKYCGEEGIAYRSLSIQDRSVPDDMVALEECVRRVTTDLRNGKAVAIHCRAGIGRSSLMAACVLITLGLTVENAWQTIAASRGLPVPDTDEQVAWVKQYAQRPC